MLCCESGDLAPPFRLRIQSFSRPIVVVDNVNVDVVIVIAAVAVLFTIVVVAIVAILVVGVAAVAVGVAVAVAVDIAARRFRACCAPWWSIQGILPKQANAVSPMAGVWSACPWIDHRVADSVSRTTSSQ